MAGNEVLGLPSWVAVVYAAVMTVLNAFVMWLVFPLKAEVLEIRRECEKKSPTLHHLDRDYDRLREELDKTCDSLAEIKERTARMEEKIDGQRQSLDRIETELKAR